MSGVYIKGVEMPINADGCELIIRIQPNGELLDLHGFHIGATAIPVPDHGRLVEADAVVEQIDEWLDTVGYPTVGKGLSYYWELLGCIEDTPTIIPATAKEDDK